MIPFFVLISLSRSPSPQGRHAARPCPQYLSGSFRSSLSTDEGRVPKVLESNALRSTCLPSFLGHARSTSPPMLFDPPTFRRFDSEMALAKSHLGPPRALCDSCNDHSSRVRPKVFLNHQWLSFLFRPPITTLPFRRDSGFTFSLCFFSQGTPPALHQRGLARSPDFPPPQSTALLWIDAICLIPSPCSNPRRFLSCVVLVVFTHKCHVVSDFAGQLFCWTRPRF